MKGQGKIVLVYLSRLARSRIWMICNESSLES